MKNKISILSISLFIIFCGITNVNGQDDANKLLAKMDKTLFGIKDKSAHVKVVMVNLNNGKEKIKEADFIQKDADKKLFRYTSPKSDSGIATLSLPNNEVYLYLPLFKKPKRITNLAEKNVFNASDFSFEDMATKSYCSKFSAELISTNDTSYVLSLKPKYLKSKYDHVVLRLNKNYFYPETLEYYNHKGNLVKFATYRFERIGGNWISTQVSMKDIHKNHLTTIKMSDIKINQGLKENLFTVESLVGEKRKGST